VQPNKIEIIIRTKMTMMKMINELWKH